VGGLWGSRSGWHVGLRNWASRDIGCSSAVGGVVHRVHGRGSYSIITRSALAAWTNGLANPMIGPFLAKVL